MAETNISLSRRRFTRLMGFGVATTMLPPAQSRSSSILRTPETGSQGLRLNFNENPYGPSPHVLSALEQNLDLVWRYPDDLANVVTEDLANLHDVDKDCVIIEHGSSEILRTCATAFAGPKSPVVVADPTFDAVERYAGTRGAPVVKVPLTADYSHDIHGMLRPKAGLIYICNPNNPTATLTPKDDLQTLATNAPANTTLLVDEAYAEYSNHGLFWSLIPQVKRHHNLIVTKTFSKIYGLAGLRIGYAIAQPDMIARLKLSRPCGSLSIMALIAAQAGIRDPQHIELCRRRNEQVKAYITDRLLAMNYRVLPSEANFLMVDLRRNTEPVIKSLKAQGVEVGRHCPKLPSYLQVTIGKHDEMNIFLGALKTALA